MRLWWPGKRVFGAPAPGGRETFRHAPVDPEGGMTALLGVESATAFLIDRGLIDGTAAAVGSFTVRDAARRNRNLRVEGADGEGYLIKQPDPLEDEAEVTLRNEVAFLRLCTG